jgi:hypothetical protein
VGDSELDPFGAELLQTPGGDERDRAGGDATVPVSRRDTVGQLDRPTLAKTEEDDSDHLVGVGCCDECGAEAVLAVPATAEVGHARDGYFPAPRARDRHPDRL